MRIKHLLFVAAISTSTLCTFAALADGKHEEHVTLESIPAPARQAILKAAHGAPVLDVEVEKKDGKTLYEAHVKQGNEVIGIIVDAEGKLIGKHSEKEEDEHEHHGK